MGHRQTRHLRYAAARWLASEMLNPLICTKPFFRETIVKLQTVNYFISINVAGIFAIIIFLFCQFIIVQTIDKTDNHMLRQLNYETGLMLIGECCFNLCFKILSRR